MTRDMSEAQGETQHEATISRRSLLQRTAALGAGAASITVLGDYSSPSAASAASQTRINLWHTLPAPSEAFWKSHLLTQFAKMYPGCDLVPRQLGNENPALIRAGLKAGGDNAPDMAWLSSLSTGAFVEAGILPDVDGWLKQHPQIRSDIAPSLLTLSSYQGKVWSIPWTTNNTCMLINVTAFNKAGVPVPSQDPAKTWTWDQFAAACAKLTTGGMKGFMVTVGGYGWDSWTFYAWLASAGGTFMQPDGTPTFNSSAGVAAATFQQNLVNKGYTLFSALNRGYDLSPWLASKVAIVANGPWNFTTYAGIKDFKFTAVPYPRKVKPATNIGGDQLFIFNRPAAKLSYCYDYTQFMLTDNFQTSFTIVDGSIPVTKSAVNSKVYQEHLKQYPFMYGWVNGIPYGVARTSLPQEDSVEQLFGTAWDNIMLKKADAKSSLDSAAQQASQLKGS